MLVQETNIFVGHLNFIYKTLKALRSCSAAKGQERAIMLNALGVLSYYGKCAKIPAICRILEMLEGQFFI
jgi:hypothetical protein